MAAGVEHHRAGAHGFSHAAVVIEGVNETADFQNRLAHRLALFFGQQRGEFFFLLKNRMARGQQDWRRVWTAPYADHFFSAP